MALNFLNYFHKNTSVIHHYALRICITLCIPSSPLTFEFSEASWIEERLRVATMSRQDTALKFLVKKINRTSLKTNAT